jgi:FixJ family two-component response regulator
MPDAHAQEWSRALARLVRDLRGHHVKLTARQAEVLCLQSLGLDFAEMANGLALSRRTVESHARLAWRAVIPGALSPTRDRATLWAFLHRDCCLAREYFTYLDGTRIA